MGFLSRWFGKRQTAPMTPEDTVERLPPGGGWRQWMYVSDEDMLTLYTADKVEAWHELWAGPRVINPRSMHPTMNVNGLWWRPVS